MKTETLRVTWKIIRREGHGRTPETYCNYIIENQNHKHRLKTREGTKLFELLDNTVIYKKEGTNHEVFVDAVYDNNNFLYVTNFRKIDNTHFHNFNTKNAIGDYKRNCPLCGDELFYECKYKRNQANRKETPCRSCSAIIRNKKRMKKKEAMKFIREQKGYIPYVALFELYNNDDEIPQELIDIECKKDEPKGNFMIVGQGLYEQLKNLK